MANTSVLCCGVSACGNWSWTENSEVFTLHSSSYGDSCILHAKPLYTVTCIAIGQSWKWFFLKITFRLVNTSVLCCNVSTCGNWLWAKTLEVFILHSSSYGDSSILHTEPLYIHALGKPENCFKLLPNGEHLCALLWCKYMWKLIVSRKFRCSPSTALVMVILAFSILSPFICALGEAENF